MRRRRPQLDFELARGALGPSSERGEIARDEPMPPGPFSVGFMHGPNGALEWPYVIRCGDGRAIAGHVNSRACADAIVDALNARENA